MTNQSWKTLDNTFKEEYTYDDHGRLTNKKTILPNNMQASIQVNYGDALGRVSSVQTPVGTTYYNYLAGSGTNTTTPFVSAMSHNAVNGNSLQTVYFTYAYDELGNITSSTERYGTTTSTKNYTYDVQSQLLSETYPSVYAAYTYDTYGNIRTKEVIPEYAADTLYEYSYGNSQWRDLLTSISITKNGETDTYDNIYDAIGNPTQYYNVNNNATWTLGWFANRSLRQAKVGTSTTINYEYDLDGLRLKKNVNGVVHNYVYASGKLLRESYTQNSTSYVLEFVYDRNGRPFMLYLTEGSNAPKIFYYLLNYQGDVVRIVTATGVTAAEYRYDAWGKATSASTTSGSTVQNLAAINPLRYRGYYYDAETGWYYVSSRYYDPGLGRFINSDDADLLGANGDFTSLNLFAYCGNNPVMRKDSQGAAWETVLDVISLGSSVAEVVANPANPWAWAGLVGDVIDVAVPFVGGIGEAVDAVKVVVGVVEGTDDVVDAAKAAKQIVSKATGSYEIIYKSGKNYVGKGPFSRAITSATEHARPNKLNNMLGDTVVSITWKKAPNSKQAFIDEYLWQKARGGVLSADKTLNTYNKIWSPGRKYLK